jgi:protocatechuate 3,4-dioxygenase beta subunit
MLAFVCETVFCDRVPLKARGDMTRKRHFPLRTSTRPSCFARLFGLIVVPSLILVSKAQTSAGANDKAPNDNTPNSAAARIRQSVGPAIPPRAAGPARDRKKWSPSHAPWRAVGRVTDANGQPLAGVEVRANCGFGTLPCTGIATSGEDGRYELDFGPGMFTTDKGPFVQAATIHARKAGYFEQDLNRQGDCLAADGPPDKAELKRWNAKTRRLFLPHQPLELNFVMRPSVWVAGQLVDEQGHPLVGYSVWLTGPELPPSSSVLCDATTDEQGGFLLEEIPTIFRFQFGVRKAHPKTPWDDSWASAALTFERSEKAELAAHFGNRTLRLEHFRLRVAGPGIHQQTATRVAGNLGVLNLTVDKPGEILEQTQKLVAAKSATLTLSNSSRDSQKASLIPDSDPLEPADSSKTRLRRSRPNAKGEFVISFENPRDFTLTRNKHQVIFQLFAGVAPPAKPERILRQLEIRDGRYQVPVKVSPEQLDDSRVSITFVTVQPNHDAWVKAFFEEGKGTTYSGIWLSDGDILPAIPFAKLIQK